MYPAQANKELALGFDSLCYSLNLFNTDEDLKSDF